MIPDNCPRNIQSMTGFSAATAQSDVGDVNVSIKSVNGKSIDVRLRLPPLLEHLETELRKSAADRLRRGSVQLNIELKELKAQSSAAIDMAEFARLAEQAKQAASISGLALPSADAILQLRGVVMVAPTPFTSQQQINLEKAVKLGVSQALDGLVTTRLTEGMATARILDGHLDALQSLVDDVVSGLDSDTAVLSARLVEQVERLTAANRQIEHLDTQRLHAEVALLVTRHDVREELDRLTSHISAVRALLDEGGLVGRKLEFLCQEFNREANTLCSKSATLEISQKGLAMKSLIDQIREQAANLA